MSDEVFALLSQKHAIRVLHFLRHREPARFSEIEKQLGLNPAQLDRALKLLTKGMWVLAETEHAPRAKRIVIRYSLSRRGEGLVKAFAGLRTAAEKQREAIGDEAVDELREIFA